MPPAQTATSLEYLINFEPSPKTVPGVCIGIAEAKIRKYHVAGRKDLTLFLLDDDSAVSGVFTRNCFCAAPVQICKYHLQQQANNKLSARALLINAGNANAGTGADGMKRATSICSALANHSGLKLVQILPFSTGVIMENLPQERILSALPQILVNAQQNNPALCAQWSEAAKAIMTTDTIPKACSATFYWENELITITGIAKGSGMISPNMATMLSFIATDANIHPSVLPELTREVADASFNCITVDGDTSTNDSFMLIATRKAKHPPVTSLETLSARPAIILKEALHVVAQYLAQAIVRDGEGATKFITILVDGGKTSNECNCVARAIANSPLVKTAFFASDPNLGRILAAIGYCGVENLNINSIELYLNELHVVTRGARHENYQEEDGRRAMSKKDINLRISLGRGIAKSIVWTCDLSHDYVRINSDYRS